MPRVLLTGATGFVGRALAAALREAGFAVREAGRRPSSPAAEFYPADLAGQVDWPKLLAGVDHVVHAAALAHVPAGELSEEDLARVRRINTLATAELAKAAAGAGVRRFVFISTAKVLGETAGPESPFTGASRPAPADIYAETKLEAEESIASVPGLPWVILRPPMLYGPGSKGNFQKLLGWIRRGWPLPFGALDNRRSLLCLDNLCGAVVASLGHPAAVGQRFLVADGGPVSTPALVREMAAALGRPVPLLPLPPGLLAWVMGRLGRGDQWLRLSGSLVVDASDITRRIGWQPPVAFGEGIRRAVLDEGEVRRGPR